MVKSSEDFQRLVDRLVDLTNIMKLKIKIIVFDRYTYANNEFKVNIDGDNLESMVRI